ncbi:hypothetical protein [Sphingopyxis sp. JAI128]|uniref:hypothetical protein n=1 Tax=Sphingopyxis sp. JAI128 TaxID=2723066 RepID=UPI00161DC097|nr:hypothetical protein [Sphingopyxis sp. JAI128]MBB6427171.1 hypothetical protein [Sphingopyxis sp. JAI128]
MAFVPSKTGLAALIGVAACIVTACGPESSASDRANAAPARSGTTEGFALAQAAQAAPAVASQAALPIEQGLYIAGYKTPEGFYMSIDDGPVPANACAGATDVFFYDGANAGEVGMDESGHWTNNAVRISRVGPARKSLVAELGRASRGFTLAWDAEGERKGFPSLALKATGPGQFIHLGLGSLGESNYRKCSFTQLSSRMQAAVRAEQPQMAGAAIPRPSAGGQAPGTVTSLPIEKGYWAVDMSCAQAIREADPNGLPDDIPFTYLDEKIDYLGELAVKRYEALGGNRYRLHGRASYGNGDPIEVPSRTDIIVNSRTSFTATSNDSMGSSTTRYTHCPISQIPRAIREIFEG